MSFSRASLPPAYSVQGTGAPRIPGQPAEAPQGPLFHHTPDATSPNATGSTRSGSSSPEPRVWGLFCCTPQARSQAQAPSATPTSASPPTTPAQPIVAPGLLPATPALPTAARDPEEALKFLNGLGLLSRRR